MLILNVMSPLMVTKKAMVISVINNAGGLADNIVEEFLETAEDMDTEEIAELLDEARGDNPDASMSGDDTLAFVSHEGGHESVEEGSEDGTESDEEISDDDDDLLDDEDRFNSAGEEVRFFTMLKKNFFFQNYFI